MRILDENTKQEIVSPDLNAGYLYNGEYVAPEAYTSIDNITKFAIDDDEIEQVQYYHSWTDQEIAQREEAEREAQKQAEREKLLLTLSEAFSEELIPSDKQGFLWKVVKLGEVEIMREYVTDHDYDPEAEDGTYLKPYKYTQGMEVTEGSWYYLDDKDLPHECIKSGTPGVLGFYDTEFFEVIKQIG